MICISLFTGLAMWVVDALIETLFILRGLPPDKEALLDLAFLDVPGHRLAFRVLFIAAFVCYGAVMTKLLSREQEMQELIEQAKKEWEETFDIINDAITIHDKDFNIIRANRAATHMLGVPFQVILSRKCHALYHGADSPPETCPSCRTLASGVPSVTETFEARLNKHLEIKALPRLDREGRINGVVHVVRDITGRVTAEEQLRSLSLTDELTGLYNRRGFMTLAGQQQKVAARMSKGFFVLFADLDGLKDINDAFGHEEGCGALVETAAILRECFRESDIIARIGGDEFVVFSMENGSDAGTGVIEARLQEKVAEHNSRRGGCYDLAISVGIAHCRPGCRYSIDALMGEADQRMYEQKKRRKKRAGKSPTGPGKT